MILVGVMEVGACSGGGGGGGISLKSSPDLDSWTRNMSGGGGRSKSSIES